MKWMPVRWAIGWSWVRIRIRERNFSWGWGMSRLLISWDSVVWMERWVCDYDGANPMHRLNCHEKARVRAEKGPKRNIHTFMSSLLFVWNEWYYYHCSIKLRIAIVNNTSKIVLIIITHFFHYCYWITRIPLLRIVLFFGEKFRLPWHGEPDKSEKRNCRVQVLSRMHELSNCFAIITIQRHSSSALSLH